MVLDSDKFSSPKTKDLVKALKVMGLTEKTLIVIDEFDENFLRAVATSRIDTVDHFRQYVGLRYPQCSKTGLH
jgi:ribosomal protein L4